MTGQPVLKPALGLPTMGMGSCLFDGARKKDGYDHIFLTYGKRLLARERLEAGSEALLSWALTLRHGSVNRKTTEHDAYPFTLCLYIRSRTIALIDRHKEIKKP